MTLFKQTWTSHTGTAFSAS